jgi:hypothetical protein
MLADERVNALSALEYWPAGPAPRYDEQTRDSVAQLEPVCLLMLRQLAAASPRIFSASAARPSAARIAARLLRESARSWR